MAYVPPATLKNARRLSAELTEAERVLWRAVRRDSLEGYRFRRQHPVPPYIADFACVAARLIVEVDGGQHAASVSDARRDAALKAAGWRVLRFWNADVLTNAEGVIEMITAALDASHPHRPHPNPPPAEPREGFPI